MQGLSGPCPTPTCLCVISCRVDVCYAASRNERCATGLVCVLAEAATHTHKPWRPLDQAGPGAAVGHRMALVSGSPRPQRAPFHGAILTCVA
jgi:hypothetical protein